MMEATFTAALIAEVTALSAQFPHLAARLTRAQAVIEEGRFFMEESGTEAMVTAADGSATYHVNGSCGCPTSLHRHEVCKHRLAVRLYVKAAERLEAEEERWTIAAPALEEEATRAIVAQWYITIQGQPFIKFQGLLDLAHARGLQALETTVVQCSPTLAVCQATAVFQDGRRFTDIGDATPESVATHLKPHFIRMAATRASARALRRALNVSACAVEELGEDAA